MDVDAAMKLGQVEAKAVAAHDRLDRLETEIKGMLKDIQTDLKDVNANMNRGKGYVTAIIFLASAGGAGALKILSMLANK